MSKQNRTHLLPPRSEQGPHQRHRHTHTANRPEIEGVRCSPSSACSEVDGGSSANVSSLALDCRSDTATQQQTGEGVLVCSPHLLSSLLLCCAGDSVLAAPSRQLLLWHELSTLLCALLSVLCPAALTAHNTGVPTSNDQQQQQQFHPEQQQQSTPHRTSAASAALGLHGWPGASHES